MKVLIVLSLFLSSTFGLAANAPIQSKEAKFFPWIQLSIANNAVNVWIQNNEFRSYNCSGSVYMYLQSGMVQTSYHFSTVFPNSQVYKLHRNYNYGDLVVRATHTILCN